MFYREAEGHKGVKNDKKREKEVKQMEGKYIERCKKR